MLARPSPSRLGRWRAAFRRGPVLIAGLAVLLLAPTLLGGALAPSSEVLGALATPTPGGETFDEAARVAAVTAAPPVAQDSTAHRAAPAVSPAGDKESATSRSRSVGEARSPAQGLVASPGSITGYAWPIRNARLTLPFGPSAWGSRVVDGEKFHDGIDLATFCGDRLTAAHGGVVLAAGRRYDEYAGWVGDLTPYTDRLTAEHLWVTLPIVVVVDDGNGYRSLYAHFRKVVVKPGDLVEAGDLLGYEGATGRASGCHLHYGLFAPEETATFGLDPEAAAHMLLPLEITARIDPLLVLPPLESAGIR